MNSRRLLYAALAATLIAGFFLTQFRIRPDDRPIGRPEEIARLVDRDDLNVLFLLIAPEKMPHFARHLSVQFRNAVAPVRVTQGKHAHAEHFALRGVVSGNVHQLLVSDVGLG